MKAWTKRFKSIWITVEREILIIKILQTCCRCIITDGTDARFMESKKESSATLFGYLGVADRTPQRRSNKVTACLHQQIRRSYRIKITEKWYKQQPNTVTNNNCDTVLWLMISLWQSSKSQQGGHCYQRQESMKYIYLSTLKKNWKKNFYKIHRYIDKV